MGLSKYLSFLILTVGFIISSAKADSARSENFGQEWIRSHPFTIMALTLRAPAVEDNKYSEAHFNSFLVWRPERKGLLESAVRQKLPWHAHLVERKPGDKRIRGVSEDLKKQFTELLKKYPGGQGTLIWDEPRDVNAMREVGGMVAWVKEKHPEILVYSNVYAHPTKYYKDFIEIVKPDVFMLDTYPFRKGALANNKTYTTMQKDYFRTMGEVRNESLDAGIPIWVFIQAFGEDNKWRVPSESEMVMHIYSSLAYGVTGIAYFTYDHFEGGLLNCGKSAQSTGKPTNLYYEAKRINPQIANIGKALRFLTSTDVRYIVGKRIENGQTIKNTTPDGIDEFRSNCDWVSKEIRDITIEAEGKGRNGLIGFFEDDKGDKYFMLVNLWCEKDASVTDCQVAMTIELSPSVKKLGLLSKETGKAEILPVKNGIFKVTLPGGTGKLFKVGDDYFPVQ